jgi:hypothetical protein
MKQRVICWFSCGAASAVAAKLAIEHLSKDYEVLVVCCDTRPSEHDDNYRFSADCERWFGQPIIFLKSDKYVDVDDVFVKTRYMSGQKGARCTTELKKIPRFEFQRADDIHVWGFTAGEGKRIAQFKENNPDMLCRFILQERWVHKSQCLYRLTQAGIELPYMYRLFDEEDRHRYHQDGFDNNNCPCCVKGSSPWYWDMMRKYFPAVFQRRAEQSRAIGARLVEIKYHKRIFLDELPPGPFKKRKKKEKMSCGPDCGANQNKTP